MSLLGAGNAISTRSLQDSEMRCMYLRESHYSFLFAGIGPFPAYRRAKRVRIFISFSREGNMVCVSASEIIEVGSVVWDTIARDSERFSLSYMSSYSYYRP